MRRRWWLGGLLTGAIALLLCGCTIGPVSSQVGFLDAITAQSPLEDRPVTVTLPATMSGANLLVAVAMGDGPGPGEVHAQAQHSRLTDTAGHAWTQRTHHLVFGSIIDVYTAPATGHDQGATITSALTVTRGDEGHALTVLAYRHGRFGAITSRNGNFGIPQRTQDIPPGADVLTAFGDGRQNTPTTPAPGFRPLSVLAVDGGPGGDRDLYQLNQLAPPGTWPGGTMLTGNLAPPASGYWGLVNVIIAPDH